MCHTKHFSITKCSFGIIEFLIESDIFLIKILTKIKRKKKIPKKTKKNKKLRAKRWKNGVTFGDGGEVKKK